MPRQSAPITARDLFRVLRRRFPVFLFTFAVTVAATLFAASKMPNIFESRARLEIQNPVAASGPSNIMDLMTGGGTRPLDTEMEKIKARPFLETVAHHLKMPNPDIEILRSQITLAPGPGGSILDISAKAETAAKAQRLADCIAYEYIALAGTEYRKRVLTTQKRLEEAESNAKQEKADAERALNAFKAKIGNSDPSLIYTAKAQQAAAARNGLEEAKKNLPQQQAVLATLTERLSHIPAEMTNGYTLVKNPVIDGYSIELANLRAERERKSYDFAPDSDEIIAIDNDIRARTKAIAEANKALFSAGSRGVSRNPDYSQLQTEITKTVQNILVTRVNISYGERRVPELEAEQRQLTEQQVIYENLLTKRQAATAGYDQIRNGLLKIKNSTILSSPYISVMESAELPKKPISPKPWLNAIMAFALGLMLASAMALLAEYLASGRLSEEEMPELPRLGGVPLLGVLPIALPPPAERELNGLPAPLNALTGAEDALREIGFTLARRHAKDPVPVVLFAGARADDLSAALTAQLAATLVRDGVRVTLIDADRQNPRLHRVFGAPDAPGLADLLKNGRRASDVLHIGAKGALRFLAAGSPDNLTEATEANLRVVFKELSNPRETDIVLVSGPSVWQVGAIGPLERASSGMTIIASGETRGLSPDEIVTRARRLLSNGYRPRILGVVIGLENPTPDAASRAALTDGVTQE